MAAAVVEVGEVGAAAVPTIIEGAEAAVPGIEAIGSEFAETVETAGGKVRGLFQHSAEGAEVAAASAESAAGATSEAAESGKYVEGVTDGAMLAVAATSIGNAQSENDHETPAPAAAAPAPVTVIVNTDAQPAANKKNGGAEWSRDKHGAAVAILVIMVIVLVALCYMAYLETVRTAEYCPSPLRWFLVGLAAGMSVLMGYAFVVATRT